MRGLARYHGLVIVACGLVVAVVVVDVALTAAVGATSRWLANGETPADSKVLNVTGATLSGIVAQGNPVGVGTATPLGVVLGQSTAAAIKADVLEENDGVKMRWVNLQGWGGSIVRMNGGAQMLFASGLKPDVVVIAVNPYMLIGHNYEVENVPRERGRFVMAIKPWIWIYNNRILVNQFARDFITHSVRIVLFRWFSLPWTAYYAPDPNPWKKTEPVDKERPLSAAQAQERLELFDRLGWYDPARYSPQNANSQTLVAIIRRLRRDGTKVYIVLMPETSRLRQRIPTEGARCFDKINQASFADDPVPIYDLRDRAADDWFQDPDHISRDRREPVTVMVAEQLREPLSGQFSAETRKAQESKTVTNKRPVVGSP
jgi:hypothetical protein